MHTNYNSNNFGGGFCRTHYNNAKDIKKTVKDLKLRLRKERHLAEAVADPGGGGGGGGGGHRGHVPPPFVRLIIYS